jgi:4-diphosphocytidyl-2-C-methyl-D-erythritol kinase
MQSIKIKCPAKINLTLEIINKREDGFHNIKSIMQTISLYDYLSIQIENLDNNEIKLSGNSEEIPYNGKNLVYKAAEKFLEATGIKAQISINIEKNIPIAAGLAGGSTDAAGTLYGLNKLFSEPLRNNDLHKLCSELGSDLNVCLEGGCLLATSRGENIQKLPVINMPVTLIKPKRLGISAKEAYTKYAAKEIKPKNNYTEKMMNAINANQNIKPYLYNDLEYAVFDDYSELQEIKNKCPNSIMSGSGSTYFMLDNINVDFGSEYQVISNLGFINHGVCEG